MNERITVS